MLSLLSSTIPRESIGSVGPRSRAVIFAITVWVWPALVTHAQLVRLPTPLNDKLPSTPAKTVPLHTGPQLFPQPSREPVTTFSEPLQTTTDQTNESVSSSAWDDCYTWQLLPEGLIYRSYLAGAKESRFQSFWAYEKDEGWIWDIALGGRVGIFRYGTVDDQQPEGFQVDLEGAALPRLDLERNNDLVSVDFRFGVPLTFGNATHQTKLAYYHLSSHVGDEFLATHPGFTRVNYSRDELVWGYSLYPTGKLRLYIEAGWAFASDVAKPWEFQYGIEYSPVCATGPRGAPFFAANAHLRQEVDFGGNMVLQAGWAWRPRPTSGLFRVGVEYFNGQSDQFSFYNTSEEKFGLAIWYDY